MISDIQAIFEQAGCTGTLYAQSLDDDADIGQAADELVIPASVVKVQIALEAQTSFADGRLDPAEPVTLSATDRTFGPTGISQFDDDTVVSWRDLVVLMLTISDNHATDTLLRRVGLGAVNATAARLGLASTVVESDVATMLDSVGQDLGCASAFRPPVKVAAKSGSLFGIVRNEIGVIAYPDGRQYAAAVFTRSLPGSDDAVISRAIGTATARAVAALRQAGT